MKLNEVKHEYKSKQYLAESWSYLTEAQQVYVGSWEKKVWPLVENYSKLFEAELTPDQINGLFKKAEQTATQSGTNQTVLGKAGKISGQIASKLKVEIEKLAKQAQDSKPIQNVDNAFDGLRTQIAQSIGKGPGGQSILSIVDKWKNYVKENPAKGAFVIAAMTSSLAFASGGIVSGMAIGFFLKLANNILTGDKLSSAVAKTGKQIAIGAIAGGLGKVIADAAADLFPAEVTDLFTSADGQTISLDNVDAMNMTPETITPEAVKELLQTRNAFIGLARDLAGQDAEAQTAILDQVREINDKIFELSPDGSTADQAAINLANANGVVGDGIDLETQTVKTGTDVDPDGDGMDITDSEVVKEIPIEQVQAAGLDYATQPPISDEFREFLEDKGLNVDEVQAQVGFDKAYDDQSFMGINVGGETTSGVFSGGLPDGIEVPKEIDIPPGLKVGETFTNEIESGFDGIEGPLRVDSTFRLVSVDADGNEVYQTVRTTMSPKNLMDFSAIDKLSEADQDQFMKFMDQYTGSGYSNTGSVEEIADAFNQNVAQGIGGAVSVFALSAAAAKKAEQDKNESRIQNVENVLMEKYLEEGPALDAMKKAAMATVKGVGTVADKAVGGVTAVGLKAATKAIQTGKAVAHEVGNKVTVKKLQTAWTKAGKPTQIAGVVQVLQQAGMDDQQIGLLNKEVDIDLTAKADPKADAKADTKATDDAQTDKNKDGKDDKTGMDMKNFVDVEALAKIIRANDLDDEVKVILAKSMKAA